MEVSPPPTSKMLPFSGAKMVAKCTSTGQSTGQRTIGEQLLTPQKVSQTTVSDKRLGTLPVIYAVDEQQNPSPVKQC